MTLTSTRLRQRRLRLGALAAVVGLAASPAALADPGILLADARPADSASLATGQQLLLSAKTGEMSFAGRRVQLNGFTGIVGYANELAYVLVLEGAAVTADANAAVGHILILRPYGAPTSIEQFDAIRLSRQWSDAARQASPAAYASLERIKGGQEMGVWFGRLGQTSYNVAASGSADYEKSTRTLMGNATVRDIRFAGASDPMAVEQLVATKFLDALKSGDAKAVAALIDPTPFGGRGLTGGADNARLMAASSLIASSNWAQTAGAGAPQLAEGVWKSGDASLRLRTIDDFVFVSSISRGTK